MRRRILISAFGVTMAAWPLAGRAQHRAIPVIGWLGSGSPGVDAPFVAAFREGLAELGYIEGQSVTIEYRWAEEKYDRLPALVADLVSRKVDLIAAGGGTASAQAAKHATSTIPIVFFAGSDPVEAGLVASIARPGGNVTGVSSNTNGLMVKRLDLLCELVPRARIIAMLVNPKNPTLPAWIGDVKDAAQTKGTRLAVLEASTDDEIHAAFMALERLHASALVIGADAFLTSRHQHIAALTRRHAIPAIDQQRKFVEAGGLIAYGESRLERMRQAGRYAGRILKGAKPGDLPVQLPAKYELIINMKSAKAIGVTIPPSILARADEVIE